MKSKIYLFPMLEESRLETGNPYIYHFSLGLLNNFDVVNYGKHPKGGVLDILRYFFKADFFLFNWIENKSIVQGPFFFLIFYLLKIFNKKVIWVHHNVHPHRTNNWINRSLLDLFIRRADIIIIHTIESCRLINIHQHDERILCFFHPFFSNTLIAHHHDNDKVYDLLIWGNVRESKGVEEFLEFLSVNKKLDDYKIKVIGKFESVQFYSKIKDKYKSNKIEYVNRFVDNEELIHLHTISRFVFFPYIGSSVLNSGALITSLAKGTPIIGPNVGAFKEMGEMNFIYLYKEFQDIIHYLNTKEISSLTQSFKFHAFFQEHTWKQLSNLLFKKLNKKSD